jgi:hypothetical protein
MAPATAADAKNSAMGEVRSGVRFNSESRHDPSPCACPLIASSKVVVLYLVFLYQER